MKKLVFYLFILIPFVGFNQVVNHFENTNSKWYVASNFMNANQENPSHLGVTTKIWKFVGNATINNESWHKLYATDGTLADNPIFEGYIRSENAKVYYKETDTSTTQQLYDFNLEIGDSVNYKFNTFGNVYSTWLKVIEIDTVTINNQDYKRFKFSEPQADNFPQTLGSVVKEVWIEGIGSLRNPIFPAKPFTLDSEWGQKVDLTCSFIDETRYYHNESYSECYVRDILNVEQLQQNYAEIYPNPTDNKLNIITLQNESYDLEIINSLGEIILIQQLNGTTNTIDVRELKSGVYFLKIKHLHDFQIVKVVKE